MSTHSLPLAKYPKWFETENPHFDADFPISIYSEGALSIRQVIKAADLNPCFMYPVLPSWEYRTCPQSKSVTFLYTLQQLMLGPKLNDIIFSITSSMPVPVQFIPVPLLLRPQIFLLSQFLTLGIPILKTG